MATDLSELQNRLWESADQLRANSGLKASEYASPVLGLIFLRYADDRFTAISKTLDTGSGRYKLGPEAFIAEGAVYLPDEARFANLAALPEGADLGKAINDAMKAIEEHNPNLDGVLPRNYTAVGNDTLIELVRALSGLPDAIEGDGFGLIYEYFLGKFAMSEGQKGGEFFTPTSIVKLLVEILQPFKGRILDPACGSGSHLCTCRNANNPRRFVSPAADEVGSVASKTSGARPLILLLQFILYLPTAPSELAHRQPVSPQDRRTVAMYWRSGGLLHLESGKQR